MHIFSIKESVFKLYQRALALSLSKEFVQQLMGKIAVNDKQNSEQENRRRELLAVEEQAQKEKIIAEHGEIYFKEQVNKQLFAKVMSHVNADLDNKEYLYNTILHIEQAAPDILELLSVRASSIKRITPLVKSLTWLAEDLITLVNKPQYRKRADVQVHDASLAVSYIGLENLKLIMPTFILKRYLPISTAPYPLMKRKLWNDSLSIALASRVLAEREKLDEFAAFTLAMLSNIGLMAVTRCFLSQFHNIHSADLKKAFHEKDKRLHDVLVELKAPGDLLLELLTERGYQISAHLVEQMGFERLTIVEPMFDLAYTAAHKKMHPLAQVVIKARAYVDFRNLARESLIENDEAKQLLAASKITADEISLLKKTDIDHLKLKFK
jgi:hypothetical protein